MLLRSVDYGEADKIATFLGEKTGKLSALARGARKSKRRFSGSLEPFSILEIELGKGRGDLDHLLKARLLCSYRGILASLEKMTASGAALAIVRHLAPAREADERLFLTVLEWFDAVEVRTERVDVLYLAFAIRMLALAGFSPDVDRCARSGESAPPDRVVLFDPRLGSVVSTREGGGPIRLSVLARDFVRAARTKAWTSAEADDPDLRVLGKMVKSLYEHQVGMVLEGNAAIEEAQNVAGPRRSDPDRE